jgi:hypothetical protein
MNCSYCGRDNDASADHCAECGTSLTEEEERVGLSPNPHHVGGYILHQIWEYFAIKRKQLYLAGLLIGVVGAIFGAIFHPQHGVSPIFGIAVVGACGVGAVWFLTFAEKLNERLKRDREEGNPTFGTRLFFILLGFVALIFIAACIVGLCSFFI